MPASGPEHHGKADSTEQFQQTEELLGANLSWRALCSHAPEQVAENLEHHIRTVRGAHHTLVPDQKGNPTAGGSLNFSWMRIFCRSPAASTTQVLTMNLKEELIPILN